MVEEPCCSRSEPKSVKDYNNEKTRRKKNTKTYQRKDAQNIEDPSYNKEVASHHS